MITEKQKEKWVAALRSGNYEQGASALCKISEDGCHARYCCLGVLLEELYGEDTWEPSIHVNRLTSHGRSATPIEGLLPDSVTRTLMHKNDMERESFDMIADYIEAEL